MQSYVVQMVAPLGLKMASFQAWLWEFLDRLQVVAELVIVIFLNNSVQGGKVHEVIPM